MKTKEKKGKAIIGIAMAAIMLASVMAAMVTPTAAFVRDARLATPTVTAPGPLVVIGELINFPAWPVVSQIQYATSDGAGGYIPTGQVLSVSGVGVDTTVATAGVYMDNIGRYLTLTDAELDVKLQLGAVEVSSVTAGQRIDVVVDTNIPGAVGTIPPSPPAGGPNDLKLKIIDPDGRETTAGIGAPAAGAPAGTTWSVTTSGLKVGHYEFSVETYTTGSAQAAIDIQSATKTLSVLMPEPTPTPTLTPTLTPTPTPTYTPTPTPTSTTQIPVVKTPSAPRDLLATPGDGYVNLMWIAPSDDGGSPITNYKIYRGTTSGEGTLLALVGNVVTYTDNDVTNNQKYYYQVSAVNSVGEGEKSNEEDATPTPTSTTAITATTPTPTLTTTTPTPSPTTPTPTPGPDWMIPLIVALIGAVAVIIAALINYLTSRKTK